MRLAPNSTTSDDPDALKLQRVTGNSSLEPSLDRFQQSGAGLTGMAGGKLAAQFNHRELGARGLEGWRRSRGGGHAGARQQKIEMHNPHQEQSVAHPATRLDVVSGAAQQFAQIG